jgi:hypothetical protein
MSDDYARREIERQLERGPQPDEGFYRLKVTGVGETRWINVTPDRLARIAAVLSERPEEVYVMTDGSFAVAFTSEAQADEYARISGNTSVASDLHDRTKGAEVIEAYRRG